ncbi:MAG: TonB-dependent receptor [Opitutae bacterium]|nr:TonB-dependent receptor [Opitutae bacterium]
MNTPTTPRKNVRRFLARGLATGLLFTQSALMLSAQTTAAAPDPAKKPDATGEVVVLEKFTVQAGFSGSLAAAAEMKQKQKVITEVIASEDIGKLPDISIADALTRLTGLTTQRSNGRSQAISIRGLTGDFSTGLLNGREQVTTGMNRAVEFDQYPADLLNSVVVYKTASPNLISQGLAGSIDLRTVRPLSKTGRIVAVNGYYEWNELGALTPSAKSTGNRFNFSYIDQLADGKVGIALGYSRSSKPFAGQQFQAWGYPTDSGGNFALGGMKPYVRNSVLDRDGFMGVFEYKPNNNIHSIVDIYYSKFEESQSLRGMEVPLAFWSSAVLQPGYTTSGGLITKATLTNVQPVLRNDTFVRNDKPIAIGWNLVIGKESAWPVTFDASYSKVAREDFNLELWAGIGSLGTPFTTADTMTVALTPGGIPVVTPTKNYTDGSILRISDPQGWQTWKFPATGAPGYYKGFQSKDELGQFKLSTRHKLSRFFDAVELGFSYTDRYKKDGENPSGFPVLKSGAATAAMPASVGTTDFSYVGIGPIYAFDPLALFNSGVFNQVPNDGTDFIARRFQVREKVSQLYAQFDIDTKAGATPVTGNIGFRIIQTDQSSKGLSANGNTVNAVQAGDTYTQFAPSLNLNFDFTERSVMRFSLARQIARPRMYDLRASRTWGYNPTLSGSTSLSQSPWSGGGGNSALRPWVADSVDLSYEHYFKGNKGYVAVAGFAKKLRNFIYEQSALADFSGYPVSGAPPALRQGVVSQPMNGDGGNIRGLELTVSLASELLNENIRGFGVVIGGALTRSSIKPWGPTGGTAPIAGLSEKVANITAYYERHGFSARVSNRYRSANRQYITTFGPPNPSGDVNPNGGFSMAQPESVMDAQISYTFGKNSRMKNLSIFLQGYNLTNEPLVTYNNDDPRQVINYQKYGASYSFGAAYKF